MLKRFHHASIFSEIRLVIKSVVCADIKAVWKQLFSYLQRVGKFPCCYTPSRLLLHCTIFRKFKVYLTIVSMRASKNRLARLSPQTGKKDRRHIQPLPLLCESVELNILPVHGTEKRSASKPVRKRKMSRRAKAKHINEYWSLSQIYWPAHVNTSYAKLFRFSSHN